MPVRSLKAAAPVSSATSSASVQSFWTAPALPRPPPDAGAAAAEAAAAAVTEAMAVASVAESGKERGLGLRSLLREGAAEPGSAARSRRELGLGFGEERRRRSRERARDLEREVRFLERGVAGRRRAAAAAAEAASSMACGDGRLEGIGGGGARAREAGDSNFGGSGNREEMWGAEAEEGEGKGSSVGSDRRRLQQQHSGVGKGARRGAARVSSCVRTANLTRVRFLRAFRESSACVARACRARLPLPERDSERGGTAHPAAGAAAVV